MPRGGPWRLDTGVDPYLSYIIFLLTTTNTTTNHQPPTMATMTTLPQEYLLEDYEHYTSQNHPFRIQVIPTGDVALDKLTFEDFVLHTWLAQCEAKAQCEANYTM